MSEEGNPTWRISKALKIPHYSTGRIVSILNALGKAPSQERVCVCVLNHPDMTDEEVADLFGRNVRWVEGVRANREKLRAEEPFPLHLEFFDDGLRDTDPTQFEIAQTTAAIRACWKDGVQGVYKEGIELPYRPSHKEVTV